MLAIVLQALVRIARRALGNGALRALAVAAFVAIFAFGVPFPLIVLVAGRDRLDRRPGAAWPPSGPAATRAAGGLADADSALGAGTAAPVGPGWLEGAGGAGGALARAGGAARAGRAAGDDVFARLAVFFSQMAVVTFGGAYAVLAYVAQEAVQVRHWLTPGEMLDGLGLAETTPGPLIMVVQFVGFLAAFRDPGGLDPWLAAVLGAVLVTWVTFVPSFLWIFLGAPYIERLRGHAGLDGALTRDHRGGGGRDPEPRGLVRAARGLRPRCVTWRGLRALAGAAGAGVARPGGAGR